MTSSYMDKELQTHKIHIFIAIKLRHTLIILINTTSSLELLVPTNLAWVTASDTSRIP